MQVNYNICNAWNCDHKFENFASFLTIREIVEITSKTLLNYWYTLDYMSRYDI